MGKLAGTISVAVLAVTGLMASASQAGAAVQVGSNFTAIPNQGPAPGVSSTQNTPPTAATLPLTSPISGVIVSIGVEHGTSGADPGTYGFRVLTGSPTTYSTPGIPAELPDFSWPANQMPGITGFSPSVGGVLKGIPIAAGDRLGVVRSTGTTGQGADIWSTNSPGGSLGAAIAIHNSGSQSYLSQANQELMVQYIVEPDCDSDGFGDETQDQNLSTCAAITPTGPALGPGGTPVFCKGKPATIVGTAGSDVRIASPGRDVIAGLGGNDRLSGLAGSDLICGGKGKDTLIGGKANDTLLGQKGRDILKGGGAKDICKGGKGDDSASKCEVEKSI